MTKETLLEAQAAQIYEGLRAFGPYKVQAWSEIKVRVDKRLSGRESQLEVRPPIPREDP